MKTSIGIVLSMGVLLVSCTKNARMKDATESHDDYFMTQVAYANMSFAETAQLAAQKTEDENLKALISELSMDYKNAYNELKEISSDLKYPIPSKVNREHVEGQLKLLRFSGKEFDTAYINSQIRNNLNMIDLLEAQANGGRDLFLKRYAMKYIPVMKLHVYRADSILAIVQNTKNTSLALDGH